MTEQEQDAAARYAALEVTMIYVLATLAATEVLTLDKVHTRLVGHVSSAISCAQAMRPDQTETTKRMEAVACATLDRMFATARQLS